MSSQDFHDGVEAAIGLLNERGYAEASQLVRDANLISPLIIEYIRGHEEGYKEGVKVGMSITKASADNWQQWTPTSGYNANLLLADALKRYMKRVQGISWAIQHDAAHLENQLNAHIRHVLHVEKNVKKLASLFINSVEIGNCLPHGDLLQQHCEATAFAIIRLFERSPHASETLGECFIALCDIINGLSNR